MRLNRELGKFKQRKMELDASVTETVRGILTDIKARGDAAAFKYAEKFDGYTEKDWLAKPSEMDEALENTSEDLIRILQRSFDEIKNFHSHQLSRSWSLYKENGVIMGQILRPLQRVGLYVPGGTAPLISSLLMCAVPALLAGVPEMAVFTPAKQNGKAADSILAAARICGIKTVYRIGGAQAVAAAAYGTETIKKVDKIVGPGNIYVITAKRLVYGEVDIDMINGPSEVLIIADETASPKYIAADLMSQAEHDLLAGCILISTCENIITETEREIERQLENLSRKDIIKSALDNYGAAILADSLDRAFDLSNELAPEHLEILTADPLKWLPKVKNAGSIFLGEHTPEPLGDYISGTNHVLPTSGTARFFSPLGVYDFVKQSAYSYYPREALAEYAKDAMAFARAEGLDAHANAIKVRFD